MQLVDPDKSLFAQNPGLKDLPPFNELHEMGPQGDKIIKALYYIHDIKSTWYAAVPIEKERIKDVSTHVLGDSNFPWKDYAKFTREYKKNCRTELQRRLASLRNDLSEREIFYRSLSWEDPQELQMKETMRISQASYLEEYHELEDLANQEIEELESLGGYTKSFIETLSLES